MSVCFFAGAGDSAGPGQLPSQIPVIYGMQGAPVLGSFTGYPAQSLVSVGPVPQASYIEQAVPAGVNYPHPLPRETLPPCVPLPPFSRPGVS